MKPLAYALLIISILMDLYCTLVRPGAFNFWYATLMFGLPILGGMLYALARKREQQNGE